MLEQTYIKKFCREPVSRSCLHIKVNLTLNLLDLEDFHFKKKLKDNLISENYYHINDFLRDDIENKWIFNYYLNYG